MILGNISDSEESSNWLRARFLDDSPFAINSKMQSLHNHMPLFLGIFSNPYAMMNLDVWHVFRCIRGRVASFREVTCTNHMPLFLGIFSNPYAMMNLDVWHVFRCIRGRVASFREVTCTKLQSFKLYMTYN